ncbi:MAG: hypothetical protein ACYSW8_28060 [Planctomycetota bacterium]|jgi:hypothetical protein
MAGVKKKPGPKKGTPKTPGSGRKKGSKNKQTIEVKEMARELLENKDYQRNLLKRLKAGELPPQLETLLYHYRFGKPAVKLEVETGPDLRAAIEATLTRKIDDDNED